MENPRFPVIYRIKASQEDIERSSSWDIMEFDKSVFLWKNDTDETCIILKGMAIVQDMKGEEVVIKEGDKLTFRKGASYMWKVLQKIKKRYILHS